MRRLSSVCLAPLLWLSILPSFCAAANPVPTPESYFGHKIGADRELLDWDKVVGYFQLLAKSSDRIRVASGPML